MITSTSRSATISLLRSARRITPVVPTGTHGVQRRRRVAAVGSDHQPGPGRDVHERGRRAGRDEHLARRGSSRGGPRRTRRLDRAQAVSTPCSAISRRTLVRVGPGRIDRLGARRYRRRSAGAAPSMSATVDQATGERRVALGHQRRDLVREGGPVVGSLELDLHVVDRRGSAVEARRRSASRRTTG